MKRLYPVFVIVLPAVVPASASAQGQAPQQAFALTTQKVGAAGAVLAGRTWQISGQVQPAVAGQQATVTFRRRGAVLRTQTVALDALGSFSLGFRTRRGGQITVQAEAGGVAGGPPVRSNQVKVSVLARVDRKSRGGSVRELQRMLRRKGYVVGAWGVYDARTARAVMAFRKVTGMRRTFSVDKSVLKALARGRGTFKVRFPKHGRHVEADISRQVMVFADGSRVQRIYHVSSGAPGSPTVRGSYRVYLKTPGTNAKGMVFSSYFTGGYAIHGYESVPPFNASHGCLRVPVPDAVSIYRWVRQGTRVDTYL
jgi:hypothetical protein